MSRPQRIIVDGRFTRRRGPGTPLPPGCKSRLADELEDRLASDPELADAFDELTPGRQREFNLRVSGAKRASTRERCVDKIVPRILEGKGLRDR